MRTLSAIIGCASRAHPLNSSRPDPIRPICSLAEQNVYTLQELNALVEIKSQKERANLEASQHAAESAMLNAWEEAQGMNALANSAARGMYAIANDQPTGLAVVP